METNDQMVQGGGNVSQMHFPVICKSEHCKSENFPRPWWGAHWKINPYQSIELLKDLSLKLIVKRSQKSVKFSFPLVDPELDH